MIISVRLDWKAKGILSLTFLTMGFLIYYLFRPYALLKGLLGISATFRINEPFFQELIVYTFPDSLWYSALLILLPKLWWCYEHRTVRFLSTIYIALPFFHEFCQYFNIFPGTFSIMDLIMYAVVLLIFIIIWRKNKTLLS